MKDDVAKRFRAFIRRGIRSGAIKPEGYLDLHGEGVSDAVARLGEAVLTVEWSTDPPVERHGTEVVYRLAGKYLRSLSSPPRWAGPFTRLLDAMGGAVPVGQATRSITSPEWSETELIARMQLVDPPPVLLINGREWRLEDLQRAHKYQTRDPRVPRVIYPVFGSASGKRGSAPEAATEAPRDADATGESESAGEDESSGKDEALATAYAGLPAVFLATSYQAPSGRAIICTSGPPDPLGIRTDELRRADGLLRTGMVALARCKPPQLERAERCFREALDLLTDAWEEPHPRISYALDRIGVVRHLQSDFDEAEQLYLRSLKVLGPSDRPTSWNDVTLLNLARLYVSQGRQAEADAVMRYFRGDDEAEGTP